LRLPHHMPDAVAALDVHLTDEEIRTLEEPYSPNGFLTGGDAVPQSRLPRFGLRSLGRSGVNVIQRAKYGGVQ
jgi:hypothetical protein